MTIERTPQDVEQRKPRWKLELADRFVGYCGSCGCKVSHEIACGMAVTTFCSACMREIADELDRRDAR